MITAVRIAAGDPTHRARPTWDQPQPHANNVTAAVVSLFKMEEATRYADYNMASSTLNTALLASIGEQNRNHLNTALCNIMNYKLLHEYTSSSSWHQIVKILYMMSEYNDILCIGRDLDNY